MFKAFRRWWKGEPPRRPVPPPPTPAPARPFRDELEELDDLAGRLRRGEPPQRVEELARRGPIPSPPGAERLLGNPDCSAETVGILSFHRNGYIREAAVRRLDSIDSGAELPLLLLRLTDWVPQVRDAARPAVFRRIRPDLAPLLVREFALFERAMRAQRADATMLRAALARVLATEEGRAAVRAAPSRGVAKFVLDSVPEAVDVIAGNAFSLHDPVIRVLVIPFLARSADALPSLLRLARDRFPPVRREALVTLARSYPAEARPVLEDALSDRSRIVRHAAAVLLGGDVAARYRALVRSEQTPRRLAAAIAGLAELGGAADAASLASSLTHAAPSVRRAALKAVMRLDESRYTDRVRPMLLDPFPAVSAAARDTLRRHPAALDRPSLLDDLRRAPAPHARRNILRVIAALPKWDALTGLLTAAADGDPEAPTLLETWNRNYNRSPAQPSRRQVEDIAVVFGRAVPRLPAPLAEVLRFTLQPFTQS